MKRTIKLSLTVLFMLTTFLTWPEKMPGLKVEAAEAAEATISSEVAMDEIISKTEVYLKDYLKEFPMEDLISEKIDPKEHLTKKLEADHFTEEEISKFFEVWAEKKQEELLTLAEMYFKEEPLLSKKALISKLTDNSYSQKEIEQAIELIDVDWKEQAVKASEEYINTEVELEDESYEIISRICLRQFLIEEKEFTLKEATYGVEESAIDWDEQAFKQAKYYLAADAYSKKGLIEKLIADEFTKEEAKYGVTQIKTDWKDQALKKAESYLVHSLLQSKEGLLNYLLDEGFTAREIDYAVNLLFKDADEEELEVEEPSVEFPPISVPERPIIIQPLEFITDHIVITIPAATDKSTDSKDLSIKEPSLATTKKPQSTNNENPRVAELEEVEDQEDEEQTSLFDSPVFAPVIMVLVVGNLYLFQKS